MVFLVAACGAEGTADTTPSSAGPDPSSSPSVPDRPLSEGLTLKPAGSVEGAPLGYAEYLPPGYGDGRSRPLLIFLHGVGEAGDGSEEALDAVFKLAIPRIIRDRDWSKDRPFIVLMPQYPVEDADACQLAEHVDSFLTFALEHYDVDEDRVYLTAVSCGAIGAWDYLATYGNEVVSAAVLISGHAKDALQKAGCDLGEVPIWVFHGAEDSIVPRGFVADQIAELRACDPPPDDLEFTVYPGRDHNAWGPTYTLSGGHDIYAWLLDHEGQRP
jgi:predicted peptidase